MKFCLCLLLIITSVSIYAQDIEYSTPESDEFEVYNDTESNTFDTQSNSQEYQDPQIETQDYDLNELESGIYENDDSIFKFAWEKSHYGYDYELARQSGWLDPSAAGIGVIAFSRTRHEQKGDSYAFSGYLAFRPFLLDFGGYSIAFGVSYFGAIQRFNEPDNQDAIVVGGANIDTKTDDIGVDLQYQSFNFSVLASFPEIGFQIIFEIGYLHDQIRANFDNINAVIDIGGGQNAVIIEDDYHYKQEDHNLYMSLEFKKLFAGNFFSAFSLLLYANINLNSEIQRSSAVAQSLLDFNGDGVGDIQIDAPQQLDDLQNTAFFGGAANDIDPQGANEIDPSYVGAFFSARVINIPLGLEFLGETAGIGIDALSGIEYGAGEAFGSDIHGAALQAGVSVSFFDFFSVNFTNTWHQRNDFDDEWNLTIVVGLYGPVTPNVGQRSSGKIGGIK